MTRSRRARSGLIRRASATVFTCAGPAPTPDALAPWCSRLSWTERRSVTPSVRLPSSPVLPAPPGLLGLYAVVHFHEAAVVHSPNGVVGTGNNLVSGLQPRQHFEVLVARDAHLDRQEFRLAVTYEEDALGFFARVAGRQFGGRGHWFDGRRSPAFVVGLGFLHHLPIRIVDQLPDGDRRDRDGHHALTRGRGDVGRAGEARAHVNDGLIEDHNHLEVRRLRAGRRAGRRLNRAVADLADVTLERFLGDGVDRDLRQLADLDVRDVRFVDFDLRLNDRHVGERQQP